MGMHSRPRKNRNAARPARKRRTNRRLADYGPARVVPTPPQPEGRR